MPPLDEQVATGLKLHKAGDLDRAALIYRRVLEVDPQRADALHLLGMVAQQRGQYAAAIEAISGAIALHPEVPAFHNNLGLTLMKDGQTQRATGSFQTALRLRPDYAECHYNLGNVHMAQQKLEEAAACYREALRIRPNYAKAHHKLGTVLQGLGRLDEAEAALKLAVAIDGQFTEAIQSLAELSSSQRKLEMAEACYRRLLKRQDDSADMHNHLGNTLKGQGKLTEAAKCFERALQLNGGHSGAQHNLANAYMDQGRLDEAAEAFRRTLKIRPDHAEAHSALLFCLNHCPDVKPEELFAEHCQWAKQQAGAATSRVGHENGPDPDRRLRIGYVSPDFREHVVARFIEPILANHDPESFDAICYSQVDRGDEVTAHLQGLVKTWRRTSGLSDQQVVDLVRDDRIDILVDLAGHTGGNRLRAMAYRPAPVQVTYLGYPNTTGLSAIDYRLTDGHADPVEPSGDRWYTETLVRLAHGFLCFAPQKAPAVSALPARTGGHVTFGSFNRTAKTNPQLIGLWADALKAVPDSRLLLKTLSLNDPPVRQRYLALFEQHGVGPDRLIFQDYIHGRQEHLATYGQLDIALDPFPYSGTTTTCDALWMGVPFVTLAGTAHAGRVGVSLAHQIGMPQLAAESAAQYVKIAAELAGDLDELQRIRADLRDRVLGSALCDGSKITGSIEQAYREMWRKWCGRRMPNVES